MADSTASTSVRAYTNADASQTLESSQTTKSDKSNKYDQLSTTNRSKPKARINSHAPLQKYELTHNLLYERQFFGETYISAHLRRLQNGVFVSPNVHPDLTSDQQDEHLSKIYVTFAATSFTLHPSLSEDHRFTSAVIEIQAANGDGQQLRVLRFAPHLVFGRISSASLKWNFQLGASLGVAQGPAKASLDPKIGYEKDLVVGSFMRIQGSTRSVPPNIKTASKVPDTVIVWSLEENSQQEGGLPREFTFVFLLERPLPRQSKTQPKDQYDSQCQSQPPLLSTTTLKEGEEFPCCTAKPEPANLKYERIAGIDVFVAESRSCLPTPPKSPPPKNLVKKLIDIGHSLAARAHAKSDEIAECIHSKAKELEAELKNLHHTLDTARDPEPMHITGELPNARKMSAASSIRTDKIFTQVHFHISVKPRITNASDKSTNLLAASDFDESIVEGQVGQRFGAWDEENEEGEESVLVDGLYNFAAMGGHFEELVELPGSSVGSIEPSLPAK